MTGFLLGVALGVWLGGVIVGVFWWKDEGGDLSAVVLWPLVPVVRVAHWARTKRRPKALLGDGDGAPPMTRVLWILAAGLAVWALVALGLHLLGAPGGVAGGLLAIVVGWAAKLVGRDDGTLDPVIEARKVAARAKTDEEKAIDAAKVQAGFQRNDIEARAKTEAEMDPVKLINDRASKGLL